VLKTLPAGDEPTAFCYSPGDNRMYWVNEWSHTLAAADADTNTQVQLISLGAGQVQPVDVAYNTVNDRVYTANRLTYTIGVVDTAPACPADLDDTNSVDGGDLSLMLLQFGDSGPADLDRDGAVSAGDVALLLLDFGPCA